MARNLASIPLSLPLLAAPACDPHFPLADASPSPAAGAGVTITLEPPASPLALPRVLRIHGQGEPEGLALVKGTLGPSQLRELAQQTVSGVLAERMVPALSWTKRGAWVLAPTVPLEPGAEYTLAVDGEAVTLRVADQDPVPLLARVWPPEGGTAPPVWCGSSPLPRFELDATLEPEGPTGRIRRGAVTGGAGEGCVRFDVSAGPEHAEGVPPPVIVDGSVQVRLDPAASLAPRDVAPTGLEALPCEEDEVAFGPGCARIADDRLLGRSPSLPVLWAIAGAGVDQVFAVGAGDPFVIRGLPPATFVTLDVATVDAVGMVLRMLLTAVTAAPMSHVILNEVFANPLGPEPAGEWVEIVNDGAVAAQLDGYRLWDSGGETALPPVSLGPGEFALLVNETFSGQDEPDPAPAKEALVLRVPHLGTNGLSNAGEPLALRDASGATVSRFPASPKPKAGQSLARRLPAAPDQTSASFALANPSPGRANGW